MKIPNNFSVQKAHKTQTLLAKKIVTHDRLPQKIRSVAGVDVAYVSNLGIGAVSVVDYDSLELLESEVAVCEVKMPYVPTLLSFRELPPTIKAIRKLKTCPDVFLVDAQGLAHPYRCGFACHLGLVLGKPTIGVAKSRLFGMPVKVGTDTFLMDNGEVVGAEVKTSEEFKPVYVSVGHLISLESAIWIVKRMSKGRLSEPILQAHALATKERNRLTANMRQK